MAVTTITYTTPGRRGGPGEAVESVGGGIPLRSLGQAAGVYRVDGRDAGGGQSVLTILPLL